MSEQSEPAAPKVETKRRWPSLVWLVPIAAVAIAVILLGRAIAERGPVVQIEFATANGLVAGETTVRFRNVIVGRIERLRFSSELASVIADARINPQIAPYVDDTARFWIVQPQVSVQGITGLDTVLSGAYVEGSWDAVPGEAKRLFTALPAPPLTPEGTPGLRVRLRASDGGSLVVGAPVLYRRVPVGRIESKELSDDGSTVEFDVFVNAPHHRRLTTATRFWDVSGVDLRVGAGGARLRIDSFAALLQGGAAFAEVDVDLPAQPVRAGHVYRLYSSQQDAEDETVSDDPRTRLRLTVAFEESVRGLAVGASVEYRGIRIGQVTDVSASVDPDTGVFTTLTTIGIQPGRLGLDPEDSDGALAYFERAVTRGLRAKLAMGNLLTGALYVNLVDAPDADAAAIDTDVRPFPELPSIESDLGELAGSVEGLLDRVDQLPIEALLNNANTMLDNINVLIASEDMRALSTEARAILGDVDALLASPGLQGIPGDAGAAVAALRALAESPDLRDAPARLNGLIASVQALVEALEAGGLPEELTATVAAARTRLEDPALARLASDMGDTVARLREVVDDPALAALPGQLGAAAENLSAILADPALAAMPGEAQAAIAALRARLEDPALAALSGEAAAAIASLRALLDDPALRAAPASATQTLEALTARLEDPAVAGLAGEAQETLAAIRSLMASPALTQLPDEAVATLEALRQILDDPALRAAPGSANEALLSMQARLNDPALVGAIGRLDALVAEVESLTVTLTAEATETLGALRGVLEDPALKAAPAELQATLASARTLMEEQGLRTAINEAVGALSALRRLLDLPATQAAPEELTATLAAARTMLDDLEQENAAGNLADALAAAKDLAADPSLRRAAGELSATLAALRAILDAPGAEDLPIEASRALAAATTLIEQFERENLGSAAVGALAGVERATSAVEAAVADLPRLIARFSQVASRADGVLAGLDVGSELNYEAVSALREVRDAARAVSDLAEAVEQKPNSLILGK